MPLGTRITAVLSDEKVATALRQPKAKPAHDGNADGKQLLEWMRSPIVYVAPVEPGRHDSSDITPQNIAMLNGK